MQYLCFCNKLISFSITSLGFIHIVISILLQDFLLFLKLNSIPLYVSLMFKFQVQNYFFHPHAGFIKSLTKTKEVTIFRRLDISVGKSSSKGQQTFEKEMFQLSIRDRHSPLRVFWTSEDSSPWNAVPSRLV